MTEKTVQQDTRNSEEKIVLPKLGYSMKEAAIVLGISYISCHRIIKRGLLKSSSAFRTKLIPHSELERFLRETLA
jgi:hypothetical protein